MEKKSGDNDRREERTKASAASKSTIGGGGGGGGGGGAPIPGLDPHALFAHSMFGGLPGSFNPLAQLSMLGQSPYGALAPPTSSSASNAYNNASAAAWWSMASQLAAQDYLARLQASTATRGFPGYPGLVPDPLLAAGYDLLAHRTPKQGGSKSSKNQNSSASTSKETSGGRSSKSDASTPSTSNSKASALGSLRLPPDTEIIHYHQQQQSSSTPSPAASLADSLQPPPPPKNSSSSGRSSNSNSHGKHHHKTTLPPELTSVSASPGSLPAQSSTTTTPKSSQGTPTASMHTSTPNSYYPFLHMPYPFMNTPLTHSTPLPSSDKKSRKTDKEASLDTGANSSTTPVPSSSSSTPRSSTRGQLVNGKPLALDVSSLIAKPSTSAELPNDDAPLNLCVKARDDSPRPTEEKVRRKPGPKPRSSKPVEPLPPDVPFSALSMFGPSFGLLPKTPDPKVTPPKASKSNSHSKKNTVASLLAQSRNGSARSPASEGNDGRSSSRVSANGDGAASPTDSLSSASHSAFQDLLRAANLSLGQIGALPSASNESTSTNGHGDDMDQDSGDDSSFDDDTDDGEGENGDEGGGGGGGGDGSKTSTDRHCGDGGSRKRRKFITDETVLRLPLTMGWRRETIIRSLGKSGVRGEVTYFAPCGRRLRQYPDVVRYLERQGIAGITRNNFSFSTRVILGEFIQPIGDNPDRGIRLSEPEVHRLVDQIRAARGWRPRPKRMNSASRGDNREEREALARQREAQRAQQRLEAQEMARQAQEAKLQQRMERERALQVAKETRRLLKEQEKQERQEAARRERELRNQQLMEARKKRQEELEKQREEEQLRKIQERERRRQHMALVKALEMRKKFEEREKKKEELRLEKKASKEKRAEERRLELEASKDVKKPVEDMELLDHKPIPKLKRIPGMKLPGKAFADLLMVFEFLHTFGETLGFDMESLPNLDSLQKAMLYDPEAEEELLSVICHLLVCAIEDPGIPHPNRHTTVLGQTLKQADITTNNVSEILRLYLVANALGDAKPPSEKAGNKEVVYENQEAFALSEWLKHKPFLSLSPSEKGSILSFLIHELLQNKAVIGQIEQSIEGQNTARRDRWIVDSKIRKLKTLHAKKSKSSHSFSKAEASCEESHEETNQSLQEGKEHKKKEDAEEENDEDDDKDDSGGEEDLHDAENHEEEEDRNLAPEELKKKMERLSRQSNQILTQLTVSDQQLRALALGQDRYRRRYWILPHGGGVFVEACESCEAPAAGFVSWEGLPPPLIQKGLSEDTEEEMKKEENAAGEEMDKKPKIEPMEMDEPAPKLATAGAAAEVNESTGEQKEPKLEEQPDKENIEEPSAAQEAVKQEPKQVDEEEAEEQAKIQTAEGQEPLPLQQQQPPQQQPQQMKLPVISPKKTVPDPDRPWFSILPREPCDDETLASLNAHDMHPMDEPMTPMTDTSERFCSEGKNRDHFEAPYARPETPRPVQPMPEGLALGWWRITEPEVLKKILESLHPRGVREREFHRLLSRYMDFASDSTSKLTEKNTLSGGDPKCMGLSTETPDPDPVKLVDIWSRETALRVDLLMLEQIESFEDRIASASMQVKGWKLPSRASCELGYKFRPICEPSTEENAGTVTPLEIARERLINVEAAIERRYLKAPLGHRVVNGKGEVVLNFLSGGPSLSETPKGLVTWREATKKCETSAQLAMCFYMLETSVAWDKSIMKASCQFCHGGDKEDQLLLCDGCDRGYHTYCFKPPMTTIPEGDWFCYECINRAVMERNCIVCGKPGQKNIVFCDACPKAYHIDCLQNPLAKVPRGKWYCQLCQHTKAPPKKKARKSAPATVSTPPRDRERVSESEPCTAPSISTSTPTPTPQPVASQESNGEVLGVNGNGENSDATRAGSPVASIASPPPPPPPPAPPTKKERSAAVAKRNALAKEKDLTPCKVLLDDLEVHDESWPFLLPVNTKQFPTYKKIIKNPMDLSTIRKKLNDGVYKTREEFCADVRLIFHNCEIFNEDDSPVGKAGHSMRVFFDARWPELTGSGH